MLCLSRIDESHDVDYNASKRGCGTRKAVMRNLAFFLVGTIVWTFTAATAEEKSMVNKDVGFQVSENRVVFTTPSMIAEVDGGVVTRLFNRLTGGEYVVGEPALSEDCQSGPVYLRPGKDELGDDAMLPHGLPLASFSLAETREIEQGVEYRFDHPTGESSLKISYIIDPQTGDLLVRQKASGTQKPVSGVRFGLGPVLCRGNLLLPVWEGIKAKTKGEFLHWESPDWDWPFTWSLQLVVFDDALGGLWIHGEDSNGSFKKLHYEYAGKGVWHVAFDTERFAPFDEYDSAEGITWRINVYEGDWTVPVGRFKEWAYQAYDIPGKAYARPDWVDDIQLQIKHADYISEEQIEEYLDLLAQHTDPAKTLLFMTNWCKHTEPRILPNWKVSDKGAKFNNEAHKRGFRTMYFANYWAITPNHPRFEEFQPYCVRNPYSGQHEGWCIRPEHFARQDRTDYLELYYVNPASKAWRAFQISEFKAAFDAHRADGLFLDQNYVVYNDANGKIDGMTIIEGNLALHEGLLEAIPGIALGGENINEISFQYESFFEMHPFSFEYLKVEDGRFEWKVDPEAFDRMVPMLTRFCEPRTRPIGYLGFPRTQSAFYPGWRDALSVYDGIPTITRPTLDEIRDADGEVRRVFRRAMRSG